MLQNNSPKSICVKFNSIRQPYGWIDSSGEIQKREKKKSEEEKRGKKYVPSFFSSRVAGSNRENRNKMGWAGHVSMQA